MGSNSLIITRMSVVFPSPLRPMRATFSPRLISICAFRNTTFWGYPTVRSVPLNTTSPERSAGGNFRAIRLESVSSISMRSSFSRALMRDCTWLLLVGL